MLDIEIVTQPTKTALDIVSVNELADHLRLTTTLRRNAVWIANMTAAINEAVDKIHGFAGELNRMVLPCTVKRYLTAFPASGKPIYLPYPDLISLDAITIEDGASPPNNLDPSFYTMTRALVPEVYSTGTWPQMTARPRAVSVTYKAGYVDFPPNIKRYVKILAAHMMENPEATILEPRQMQINRKVEFGIDSLRAALRIPVSYDDWL